MPDPRKENPFVTSPGGRQPHRVRRCSCCELPFKRVARTAASGKEVCDECREHAPIGGEPESRRLRRLEDDRKRVADYCAQMSQMLNRNEQDLRRKSEQVRSALEGRDRYRDQVIAVSKLHHLIDEGRKCSCGKLDCLTERAIRSPIHWR